MVVVMMVIVVVQVATDQGADIGSVFTADIQRRSINHSKACCHHAVKDKRVHMTRLE